jgi:hypothetical protein
MPGRPGPDRLRLWRADRPTPSRSKSRPGFTRTDPSLARPQEYRGFLLPHDNPQIDLRWRMTGVDALADIGSHDGVWNMGWFATRLGRYREEPPR